MQSSRFASQAAIEEHIEKLYRTALNGLFRSNGMNYSRVLEVLERLSDLVNDAYDVNWHIDECNEASLDSLLVGAYWYCSDYHGGMGSDEYRLQCKIGGYFDPGMSTLDTDSSEFDVYVALAVLAGHGDWDSIVEGYGNDDE